jgi:hypothetical protein
MRVLSQIFLSASHYYNEIPEMINSQGEKVYLAHASEVPVKNWTQND